MKIVFMESTLNLIIQLQGIEFTKNLIESGELKKIEEVTNYLVIYDKE